MEIKLHKNLILAEIASIGKDLVWRADPNSYPAEFRKRANPYRNDAANCKNCYEEIRNGEPIKKALETLLNKINSPPEKEKIKELLSKI